MLSPVLVSPFSESFSWDEFEAFLYRISDQEGYLYYDQMLEIAEDFQMEQEFTLMQNNQKWSVDQFVNFLYDCESESL
jgi:hypothetical protein